MHIQDIYLRIVQSIEPYDRVVYFYMSIDTIKYSLTVLLRIFQLLMLILKNI
jgi:hypothetical protein